MTRWTSVGACTHRDLDGGWARGDVRVFFVGQRGWGRTTLAFSWGAQGIWKGGLRTHVCQWLVAVHQQQGCHWHVRGPCDGLVRVQTLDILIVGREGDMGVERGRGEDDTARGRLEGGGGGWHAFSFEGAFNGDEPEWIRVGCFGGRAEVVLVASGGLVGRWKSKRRAGGKGRGRAGVEPVGWVCGVCE